MALAANRGSGLVRFWDPEGVGVLGTKGVLGVKGDLG
jgi:hypothetical protein